MPHARHLRFSSPKARVQYAILMGLFRLAWSRGAYGAMARGLGHLFGPRGAVYLSEAGGAPFRIALNDGYWTRFALRGVPYEPEVAAALAAAAGHTPLFCDLGANKGYWTCRAVPLYRRIIAVEAAAQTFAELRGNADALPNVTLHRAAIFDRSGEVLRFVNVHNSHASARLQGTDTPGPQDAVEEVETLAIDDLVPPGSAALIKLDVEGAEIAAISGAPRALRDGSVLIYEDHGGDPACAPSAHLLDQTGIEIYALEHGVARIRDLGALRALKADPFKGYNFIAAEGTSPLLAAMLDALQSGGDAATKHP